MENENSNNNPTNPQGPQTEPQTNLPPRQPEQSTGGYVPQHEASSSADPTPPAPSLDSSGGSNEPSFPSSSSFNESEEPKKSKWIGVLSLLVIIVAALHFAGFWNWIGGQFTAVPEEEKIEEVIDSEDSEGVTDTDVDSDNEDVVDSVDPVLAVGKGNVSFVVSSGMTNGTILVSGPGEPNLEIRKVYVHNPSRDSWILIYDGVRPLDLKFLTASKEKHELINVRLVASDYDMVRVDFVELLAVDSKGDQKITRERSIDLVGSINIKEGGDNLINIHFNINNPDNPIPVLFSK